MSFSEVFTHLRDTLDRCRPAFIVMEILLFMVGSLFWVFTALGGDSMSPGTYGQFAVSYRAEMWAAAMMGGSALMITGLVRPIRNWMVIIGGIVHIAQFSLLTYSAVFTGGEFVVGVFSGVFFTTWHVWVTLEACAGHDRH